MADPRKRFCNVRYLGQISLSALAYFVGARLGLRSSTVEGNVTPIRPSTGIALAALLVYGYRVWPGVVVGVGQRRSQLWRNAMAY